MVFLHDENEGLLLKLALANRQDSEQGPPRSEAVVGCPHAPLPRSERGGSCAAAQGGHLHFSCLGKAQMATPMITGTAISSGTKVGARSCRPSALLKTPRLMANI